MILPVYVYGTPVLRKVAREVEKDEEGIQEFIDNMFETMYNADGIGLAAPQVGVSKRIITIDASPMGDEEPLLKDFKKVFINPKIVSTEGDVELVSEGCLSLPGIREEVPRPQIVKIEYYDRDWNFHSEVYDDFRGRIIQHEYDHIEGVLFVDHVSMLRKRLLKSKLSAISKGKTSTSYKIKVPVR
jgi:peptide deformylase